MEEARHRWFKDEEDRWFVICVKQNKKFIPKNWSQSYEPNLIGQCPFCLENAYRELAERKKMNQIKAKEGYGVLVYNKSGDNKNRGLGDYGIEL